MVVTEVVKALLAARRERRRLLALGYYPHETDPEIIRGRRRDEVIIDAIISADGKYVYTKIGKPEQATSGHAAAAEASKGFAGARHNSAHTTQSA